MAGSGHSGRDLANAEGNGSAVAAGAGSGGSELFCLDAAKGEVCHRLVLWAMDDGLRLHAEKFPGLTRASPFPAFQKLLHVQHPEFCPPPCAADTDMAPALEVATAEAVVASTIAEEGVASMIAEVDSNAEALHRRSALDCN